MRQPKRILVLNSCEYRQMLLELIHFRNKLIQQGRYIDAVDELLIKLQNDYIKEDSFFFVVCAGSDPVHRHHRNIF